MKLTAVAHRLMSLVIAMLMFGALFTQVVAAGPTMPPASLTPPIPPDAIDVRCVESGNSIRCDYQQEFPADEFPYPFLDCGDVLILEAFTGITADVTRTYDLSGQLLQEARRVSYGTVLSTDAQPAGIGTRDGHFTATIDYQAGMIATITYTGLTAQVAVDGQIVALDAGRVVVAPTGSGTFTVLSASGRHDFIFSGLVGPGLNPQTPSPPNTQAICDAAA